MGVVLNAILLEESLITMKSIELQQILSLNEDVFPKGHRENNECAMRLSPGKMSFRAVGKS